MIRYFVRTTGKRKLDSSYSQIEYELLIDNEGNCGKAFLKQLEYVNDFDAVLLEDDLILCNNFKNRIEQVISKHSNDIINFFTIPEEYLKSDYLKSFCYNQCTYFPKGIAKKIIEAFNSYGYNPYSAEKIMKKALKKLQMKHYVYRPCLVQHLDDGSLMNHNLSYKRRSPYFIEYLDELGISYEEAKIKENKEKLMSLMEEKFKDIDKNKNQ